jgi:hypothetical protein
MSLIGVKGLVLTMIHSCNLVRTHLNDSVSSLDRNAEATEKDAFKNVDPQMLNSGRRKQFVLLYYTYVESILVLVGMWGTPNSVSGVGRDIRNIIRTFLL